VKSARPGIPQKRKETGELFEFHMGGKKNPKRLKPWEVGTAEEKRGRKKKPDHWI